VDQLVPEDSEVTATADRDLQVQALREQTAVLEQDPELVEDLAQEEDREVLAPAVEEEVLTNRAQNSLKK
jgi:hypothetical protein